MNNDIEALIAHAEKVATCIHIGADSTIADDVDKTIRSLIAALRQQQGEPVAWISHNNLTGRDTYGKLPVQSLQAGVYSHTPLFTHPPAGRELSDEEIKYMVNRFLGWRLPEHFNPDCGISFKPDPRWTVPMQPIGTNLFSAEQAEQMVRYMLDGIAAAKEPK